MGNLHYNDEDETEKVVVNKSDITSTPVSGEVDKPVSSGWAGDHVAAADPHTGYIKHSLATAINDFLVASGAGAFVKKTLAEVKAILDWAADIAAHAALITGVHGAGANNLINSGDVATDSAQGIVELATIAETSAGADTERAVTSDGLSGSIFGEKIIIIKVLLESTALTTGDGKAYVPIPDSLNGMNLVDADAVVYTPSTSGTPTIAIYNATDSCDMLSTNITIDINEYSSYTAATPPVIDSSYDDVATGDRLRIDVDVAGTGTAGLDVILTFQLP